MPVATRFREAPLGFNVKGVGATGDNATNDTGPISSVLAADRSLYFPPGIFVVQATSLLMFSNLTLVGAGLGTSIIKLINSGNGRLISHETGPISNLTIKDLGFDGNMLNQTNGASRDDRAGLFLRQVTGLKVIRCGFTNFRSGAAIRAYGCSDVLYQGNRFAGNGIRAITTGAESLSTSATNVEVDSTASWPSSGKFYAGGVVATYASISGNTFVGCTIASGTKVLDAGSWLFPIGATDADVLICDATFTGATTDYRAHGNRYFSNTDTGAAMDGVVGGSVKGNIMRENLLGAGMGWVGTETGGVADSCEDIIVEGNIIDGPNLTTVESQGIKVAKFNASGGDGGNNRGIIIRGNTIRRVDRSIWLDAIDDSLVHENILRDTVGPNDELILLGTSTNTINRVSIDRNRFKNAAKGIHTAGATLTDVTADDNEFHTDVTTKFPAAPPTGFTYERNKGYQPLGIVTQALPGTNNPITNTDPWTNIYYVRAGTISNVTKNGQSIATTTNFSVTLQPGESFTMTYSSNPTVWKDRR